MARRVAEARSMPALSSPCRRQARRAPRGACGAMLSRGVAWPQSLQQAARLPQGRIAVNANCGSNSAGQTLSSSSHAQDASLAPSSPDHAKNSSRRTIPVLRSVLAFGSRHLKAPPHGPCTTEATGPRSDGHGPSRPDVASSERDESLMKMSTSSVRVCQQEKARASLLRDPDTNPSRVRPGRHLPRWIVPRRTGPLSEWAIGVPSSRFGRCGCQTTREAGRPTMVLAPRPERPYGSGWRARSPNRAR